MMSRPTPLASLTPLLLLLLLLLLSACTTTSGRLFEDTGLLLAEKQLTENERVSYRLYAGQKSRPTINRTVTRNYERPKLVDLVVSDLNADLAKRVGAEAWKGVYVAQIGKKSSVAKSGLLQEDILLEIDGVPLTNASQFHEILHPILEPSNSLSLRVRRGSGMAADEFVVDVVPDILRGTETKTETYELNTSPGIQNLTGMQLGVVPANLSEEIYAAAESVTVVTGVITGSPAYLAGFRRGDRVTEVDGAMNPTLDELRSAVHARATGFKLNKSEADVARTPASNSTSSRLALEVDGPLGRHQADLGVRNDLLEKSEFKFPILFSHTSTHDDTEWSFLQFILQWGANYQGRYEPSVTRNVEKSTSLSIFPFGMFEFERSSDGDRRNTFFWFITFES